MKLYFKSIQKVISPWNVLKWSKDNPTWHLQMSCFVQPSLQNIKILSRVKQRKRANHYISIAGTENVGFSARKNDKLYILLYLFLRIRFLQLTNQCLDSWQHECNHIHRTLGCPDVWFAHESTSWLENWLKCRENERKCRKSCPPDSFLTIVVLICLEYCENGATGRILKLLDFSDQQFTSCK